MFPDYPDIVTVLQLRKMLESLKNPVISGEFEYDRKNRKNPHWGKEQLTILPFFKSSYFFI